MDQNEQQLQSFGICHRLFCFIMNNLAAQALKPVTLGPPGPFQHTHKACWPAINREGIDSRNAGKMNGAEETESLASIDIEDESSRLLGAEKGGWWYDHGKIMIKTVCESKIIVPKKMVRIKDEPEVINESKKRKNGAIERRHEWELRPLKSILKVGSNLSKTSAHVANNNSMRRTMD